jgi:hypothetical protein
MNCILHCVKNYHLYWTEEESKFHFSTYETQKLKTNRVCVSDVLENIDERVPRRVAVSVVAPVAGGSALVEGRTLIRPAAGWLLAFGVRPRCIVQIQMQIADVQNFKSG